MTGLRGEAAIIGIAELPAEKRQSAPPSFTLDQYARLAKMVIDDAGVDPAVVNGLSTHGIAESDMFAPATLSEYLGLPLNFGDRVDLGGATAAGMVWRAAAAVELGLCDAVLAVVPPKRVMLTPPVEADASRLWIPTSKPVVSRPGPSTTIRICASWSPPTMRLTLLSLSTWT